jgi:hypothetical protein
MTKKIIVIVLLFSISLHATSQSDGFDARHYLEKSRRQQTAGFITLGCSALALIPGITLLNHSEPGWEGINWYTAMGGVALTTVGVGFAVSSVILFVSSNKNRKKANGMALFINKPIQVNTGLVRTTLPYSVGVTVPIR